MAAGLLLCFLFARALCAQTYVNNQNIYYNLPNGPLLPQIDATAFVNQSIFSVTYDTYINNQAIYCEPWWGTLFYTNNGEMIVNDSGSVAGVGFEFDLQQTNSSQTNSMAGTFYNPGTIHCDSILDGNDEIFFDGFEFLDVFSFGNCLISATNIINPGTIELGDGGQLSMNGQNIDLNRSVLTIETGQNELDLGGNAPFSGVGSFGLNTNAWSPSANLEPPTDESSAPIYLYQTNGVPYTTNTTDFVTGNTIYKFVYIQDSSASNVSYSVYFNTGSSYLGDGEATIQWAGTYIDPANGQLLTNYLYLNVDIAEGSSTNVALVDGYPDSFTLTESSVPAFVGSAAGPGLNGFTFPSGSITNNYAYAAFTSINESETNTSGSNPSGALTNLPNRIEVTASQDLNLNLAQISGQIYMSLTATNQFDGSAGALIASPYSDINLGVTNGTLTVSNLLESQFLNWSGNIQAWSTRWEVPTTNILGVAITNDYRIVMVNSQLNPVTSPQIQNLALNATNLIITDVLNVFGLVYASAQNMTLETNVLGNGATSLDGELNLENSNTPSWSWNGSFPNLLWLTNNGSIRSPNYSDFVSSGPATNSTPAIPAVAATNVLYESGGKNVVKNNSVTIAGTQYNFTNSITSKSPPYNVLIGANFDASITNLIAAINRSAGGGKVYSTNQTYANVDITAGSLTDKVYVDGSSLTNHGFIITAIVPGASGNFIPVNTFATNLAWNGLSLSGGAAAIAGVTNISSVMVPYGAIINNGLIADNGSTMWVTNFVSGGVISNGAGSFVLNAMIATLTNGVLTAGGSVSFTAGTLETSNLVLQADGSLTLQVTNWLTDDGVTNGNIWSLGSSNGTGGNGLVLPMLPTNTTSGLNNLLGTTISMQVPPPNKQVVSTWAGIDYGVSTTGYMTNNVAIGQLMLDSLAANSVFYFTGTSVSNAIYVDRLVLEDYASYTNGLGSEQIPTLEFNTNLTIYYADAVASGEDVSYQLNHSNGGHLRWVPQYAGYFSSTNLVYPNGTTNALNIGLVTSPYLDSNGSGTANADDPYPIFVPSQWNFKFALTNVDDTKMGLLTWDSIPGATNLITYSTNMSASDWILVTNFVSPANVPPLNGWPITNSLVEPLHMSVPHGFYKVQVVPNSVDAYGQ
jgi:hypothetical protein